MKLCKEANVIDDQSMRGEEIREEIREGADKADKADKAKEEQERKRRREHVTTKTVDILFQRHQKPLLSGRAAESYRTSPKSSSTKHMFGGHDRSGASSSAKHSLEFDTFVDLVTDVADEMFGEKMSRREVEEEVVEEVGDVVEVDKEDKEDNRAAQEEHVQRVRTAAFSYLLEKKFVPLAMRKGKKIMKGSKKKRDSSIHINIQNIGQEIKDDEQEMGQEQEEGQEKESSSSSGTRRKSITATAAEVLEMVIAGRNSITSEDINFTNANEKLLTKFNKPLKVVFNFYATLTKVAPNGSSVPSSVVRTHLTYQDTQIFLRDFFLMPAYVSNSAFQELWHENQLGRDHDEYGALFYNIEWYLSIY